jgi:FKBP-type peptidyl-prolyl cis-trans isomerase FklB
MEGSFKVNPLFAVATMALLSTVAFAEEPSVLKTDRDKVNYSIGVNWIGNMKQQGVNIDLDLVIQGMKDAYAGGKLLLSDEEIRKGVSQYQVAVRQKQSQVASKASNDNRKEGEAFLTANGKKEGVVTLPSGLQYRVVKAGDGRKPTDNDTVVCHYRGTFIDGKEFDSSHRTGKPATFPVSSVIPGWREALKLMPVGSTWQLFVPSRLAYGERGKTGSIGPNMTLVFEVELLAIN